LRQEILWHHSRLVSGVAMGVSSVSFKSGSGFVLLTKYIRDVKVSPLFVTLLPLIEMLCILQESFKADDVPGGKAFVRGGTINPDAKQPVSESEPPSKL
jgi:hypothetical protein